MSIVNQMVNAIKARDDYELPQVCWVSVYKTSQAYGGPEEGGWWYTVRDFEGGVPFLALADAEAYLAKLEVEVKARNRAEAPARARAYAALPDEDEVPCPAGYSEGYIPAGWSDGGQYEVIIERRRGENDSIHEGRPHYE